MCFSQKNNDRKQLLNAKFKNEMKNKKMSTNSLTLSLHTKEKSISLAQYF